jgi:hypothetical protein
MLIFDYGGQDPEPTGDSGRSPITAPNRECRGSASRHPSPLEGVALCTGECGSFLQTVAYVGTRRLLYSNLEQKVEDAGSDEDDGGLRRRADGPAEVEGVRVRQRPSDSANNEDGVLTASWNTLDDGFVKSVVKDYLENDAVMEVHLVRMEE